MEEKGKKKGSYQASKAKKLASMFKKAEKHTKKILTKGSPAEHKNPSSKFYKGKHPGE